MKRRWLCAVVFSVVGCAQEGGHSDASPSEESMDTSRDYHSYANTSVFVTEHITLDLRVDFERRVLAGRVDLRLQKSRPEATDLVLDTRDLVIENTEARAAGGTWTSCEFGLDERDPILGSALRIRLPAGADQVRVHYRSSPEASGLQWLTKEQTSGQEHPFLYSQSQALHARSWIPLQDTPQVRVTYEARIRTPKPLFAVMSAANDPEANRDGEFHFRMEQPVPSYLIALGVGDLYFRAMGPRTGIYGERSLLEPAAAEFEDTEAMMDVCEQLYGEYRWERYDLLVLPPSFPYGGMENPRLTFLTPTSIAGDKSGVALIAHELAHSWSGNLVTNASWRDFWLNEGTTTYLTYRIMDEVYGKARGDMERVLAYQNLQRSLTEAKFPGDRALAVDQRDRDPDEVFSSIPYVRGMLFLSNLEAAFGRKTFDAFLRRWFDTNAFESRTTEDFIAFLVEHLLSAEPGVFSKEKVREWIFSPDIPSDALLPASDAFSKVDAQRTAWLEGRLPLEQLPGDRWNVLEWRHFIDNMPESATLEQLGALDRQFGLTGARNGFIARDWYRIAIRHEYKAAYPELERFLTSIGRTLLIKRLYQELAKTPAGLEFAKRVYADARPLYHSITRASIERALTEAKQAPPG